MWFGHQGQIWFQCPVQWTRIILNKEMGPNRFSILYPSNTVIQLRAAAHKYPIVVAFDCTVVCVCIACDTVVLFVKFVCPISCMCGVHVCTVQLLRCCHSVWCVSCVTGSSAAVTVHERSRSSIYICASRFMFYEIVMGLNFYKLSWTFLCTAIFLSST